MTRAGLVLALLVACVAGCGSGGSTAPGATAPAPTARTASSVPAAPSTVAPSSVAPSSVAASTAAHSRSTPSHSPAASSRATRRPPPPTIPPVSVAARVDGLLDVRSVVPDAMVDLRYATPDNFTHVRLYPVGARCLVHRSMVSGLRTAAARLRAAGLRLVFWDCYRPHAVQVRMFRVVPNPDWVARPLSYARSHEAGRSVDVTLASARIGRRLVMGTGFDDFSPRAHAFSTDVSATAQADRATLRTAMAAGGLAVYAGEWWHFDGPGFDTPRPFLRAGVD